LNSFAKPYYPDFSWNRLPLYFHFGKYESELNIQEADFVAGNSNFVCLEKNHAHKVHGNTETGTIADMKKLRNINPKLKILFYLNSFINYPFYDKLDLSEDLLLKDENNELILKNNIFTYFDLSNPQMRMKLIGFTEYMLEVEGFDGLFIDAVPQVECSFVQPENVVAISNIIGIKRHMELIEGLRIFFKTLRSRFKDKIIIYNGMRTNDNYGFSGKAMLEYSDGAAIEHFGFFYSKTPESMRSDIIEMEKAGKQGKIVIFKAWPGFCWLDEEAMKKSQLEKIRISKSEIGFMLACFLAGAQPYSYFCYSWGYQNDHGFFEWYEEYDKFIGKPINDSIKEGYTFRRDFEGVRVFVDVLNREYELGWI